MTSVYKSCHRRGIFPVRFSGGDDLLALPNSSLFLDYHFSCPLSFIQYFWQGQDLPLGVRDTQPNSIPIVGMSLSKGFAPSIFVPRKCLPLDLEVFPYIFSVPFVLLAICAISFLVITVWHVGNVVRCSTLM